MGVVFLTDTPVSQILYPPPQRRGGRAEGKSPKGGRYPPLQLSLKEKLEEGLYNSKGKPRLFYARNYFFDVGLDVDLEDLKEFYDIWREFQEWMVLQRQEYKRNGEVDKKTIAVKCSKRGNDVYFWKLRRRLKFLEEASDQTFFDPHENFKETNCLLVTLTYDTKISSLKEAWEGIGLDLNRYVTNLRKKFGRISYVRVWEAFFNGYPHVHILMVFHDYDFRVYRHNGKWRIRAKGEFEKGYHSFVDVQGVRSFKAGCRYVTKYLTKGYRKGQDLGTPSESSLRKNLSDLTLALCWIFRKQSFAISRDLHDLITLKRNSNRFGVVQLTLGGGVVEDRVEWVFVGIKSLAELKSGYPELGFGGVFNVELPRCVWGI